MGNAAPALDEAPLTWRNFPVWALFIVVFAVVTIASAVLIAAMNVFHGWRAPPASNRSERARAEAATRQPILSPVRS
jgi:hypothetical protein